MLQCLWEPSRKLSHEMDTELSNLKKLWTKRLIGNSPLSHTSHIQGVPSSFCYLQFGFGGRLFSRDWFSCPSSVMVLGKLFAVILFGYFVLISVLFFTIRLQYSLHQVCYVISLCQALILCAYCTLVFVQRYHLFVWSVFSPKLLYEAMKTLLLTLCVIVVLCLTNLVGRTKIIYSEKPD